MNRAILGAPFTSQSARIRCPNVCVTKEPNVLPPVTDDLVKPMLMFKAVIKYPAVEFPRSPTVATQMRTTSSTLWDQASYPSNEMEISHGRVAWQTR